MIQVYIGYIEEVLMKEGLPTLELKVRVPSKHGSSISVEDLPIARPLLMAGVAIDYHRFLEHIEKINKVLVYFESNNLQKPIYFGVIGNSNYYDIPLYDKIGSGGTDLVVLVDGEQVQEVDLNNLNFDNTFKIIQGGSERVKLEATATTISFADTKLILDKNGINALLGNAPFLATKEEHVVTRKFLDSKSYIQNPSTPNIVYTNDLNGNLAPIPYSAEPTSLSIPLRTTDGRLKATMATEDNDVVTLGQANDTFRKSVRISVSSTDHQQRVIALVELDNEDIGKESFFNGTITFNRSNGVIAPMQSRIMAQKQYNSSVLLASIITNNILDTDIEPRLCTFIYDNKLYGGIEYYIPPSYEIVVADYDGSITPFSVDYYDKNTGSIKNAEINDSISFSNNIYHLESLKINGNQILTEDTADTLYKPIYSSTLERVVDDRTSWIPNNYNNVFRFKGITTNGNVGITDGGDYSSVLGLRGWGDSSGGNAHELAFTGNNGKIKHRFGATTSWSNWKTLAHEEDVITSNGVFINANIYTLPNGFSRASGSPTNKPVTANSQGNVLKLNTTGNDTATMLYHDLQNNALHLATLNNNNEIQEAWKKVPSPDDIGYTDVLLLSFVNGQSYQYYDIIIHGDTTWLDIEIKLGAHYSYRNPDGSLIKWISTSFSSSGEQYYNYSKTLDFGNFKNNYMIGEPFFESGTVRIRVYCLIPSEFSNNHVNAFINIRRNESRNRKEIHATLSARGNGTNNPVDTNNYIATKNEVLLKSGGVMAGSIGVDTINTASTGNAIMRWHENKVKIGSTLLPLQLDSSIVPTYNGYEILLANNSMRSNISKLSHSPEDVTNKYYKITLPMGMNGAMITMDVTIFAYYRYQRLTIRGYLWGGGVNGWYDPEARITSSDENDGRGVVFGQNTDGTLYVAIECLGGYGGITVDRFTNYYHPNIMFDLYKDFPMELVELSSLTNISKNSVVNHNVMTLDTTQTITSQKTFNAPVIINSSFESDNSDIDFDVDYITVGGQRVVTEDRLPSNTQLPILIRDRIGTTNLTEVGSGDTVGSVALGSNAIPNGTTVMLEVAAYTGGAFLPKIVTVTIGRQTTTPNSTDKDYIASFTTYNGSNMAVYSFTVSASGNSLYFGSKKYIQGAFSGSTISWTTGTYTLYVGRIWRLNQ